MGLSTLEVALLLAGGLAAGVINAIAGAGSLLTLPLLVFVGLPPTVANATNRVGVLVQNVAATWGYARASRLPWELGRPLLLPTLLGALAGTWLATLLSDEAFEPLVALLLVAMALLLAVKPKAWLEPAARPGLTPALRSAIFFGIGAYAGFLQAGVGFLLLAALVHGLGADLVRANGLKVLLVLVSTALALAIFVAEGMVAWWPGLVLAIGTGIGGYLGSRLAVAKGAGWVRWALLAAVIASALELLGIFRRLGGLLGL